MTDTFKKIILQTIIKVDQIWKNEYDNRERFKVVNKKVEKIQTNIKTIRKNLAFQKDKQMYQKNQFKNFEKHFIKRVDERIDFKKNDDIRQMKKLRKYDVNFNIKSFKTKNSNKIVDNDTKSKEKGNKKKNNNNPINDSSSSEKEFSNYMYDGETQEQTISSKISEYCNKIVELKTKSMYNNKKTKPNSLEEMLSIISQNDNKQGSLTKIESVKNKCNACLGKLKCIKCYSEQVNKNKNKNKEMNKNKNNNKNVKKVENVHINSLSFLSPIVNACKEKKVNNLVCELQQQFIFRDDPNSNGFWIEKKCELSIAPPVKKESIIEDYSEDSEDYCFMYNRFL
jgi:hypothetical protein